MPAPIRISGFTFIRNGQKFYYPFEECIRSMAPVCDEIIVNVGKGEDQTLEVVQKLSQEIPKIRIIENTWDESLREGGRALAHQTDLALAQCRGKWGLYLQADEVLHEDDLSKIQQSTREAEKQDHIDGLLFNYLHFYGHYSILNQSPSNYRREVRLVRLDRKVFSYRDAQGFRIDDGSPKGRKLRVRWANARIFHYGWVRPPRIMKEKTLAIRNYHQEANDTGDSYTYRNVYGLKLYDGSHPKCMEKRIGARAGEKVTLTLQRRFSLKDMGKIIRSYCVKLTGWLPFEYRNYRLD